MSTLNKISLDGSIYNISNFHYIENNSASNPFIITEHEPGIYVVKGSDADQVPGKLYSKYIDSEDYYVRTDNFKGFLCLTDTSIDETYQFKNIGYIFDASQAVTHPCYTQPAPYGSSLTSTTAGIGNTVVNTYDIQTISGKKTFSVLPESSVVPTTNNQLTTKKYVDDSIKDNNTVVPKDGTGLFGVYAHTQSGGNLTETAQVTPTMVEDIKVGQVYEWPNAQYLDTQDRAVVTGTTKVYYFWAPDATEDVDSYKIFQVYLGNGNKYEYYFDDTNVYKEKYPTKQ